MSDEDHSTGRAYGAERGPGDQYPDFPKRVTFLIDPDGVVAKFYEVSDIGAHPGEVLDDMLALSGGGSDSG